MGLFSDVFEGGAAKAAAENNRNNLATNETRGYDIIGGNTVNSINALDAATRFYDPVRALGTKYSAAGDMALNALGLNGAAGNDAATAAFRSSPGYDFKVNQSLDALDRRAASRGLLGSGNNTLDTLNVVHGLADQDYNNWLTGLGQYATLGANETNTGAAGSAAMTAAKVPVYTNDTANKLDLSKFTVSGINDQNTQAANAAMQGGANALNFGLNLGKLAIGSLGSGFPGTSFLGGSTGTIGGTGLPGFGGLY